MCSMYFTTSVLIVLWLARVMSNSGVFRYNSEAPHGSPVYLLYVESKNQCLRACYEESECAVVEYNETDDGHCRLYKNGSYNGTVQGYVLFRGETDSQCMTEENTSEIHFKKIPQRNATAISCKITRDVNVIKPFVRPANNYRFFFLDTSRTANYTEEKPRLFFSRKAGEDCTAVPVFRKANFRRSYFREIYNATGYFFYHAYAFADYCVSPQGECLGVQEIEEYTDIQGNFFYDKPKRKDMTNSGLEQTFYIAKIED